MLIVTPALLSLLLQTTQPRKLHWHFLCETATPPSTSETDTAEVKKKLKEPDLRSLEKEFE